VDGEGRDVKDLALERGFGEIVKTIDEIERRRERRRNHRSPSSRSLLSPSHSIQSSPSSLSPVHHSQERQRRRRELESAVTLGRVLEAEFQRKEQRERGGSSEEDDDENSSILSNSSSSSLDDNFISDESSLEGGHTSESTNSLLRGNLSSNPIPSVREPFDRIDFMTNETYSDLDEEDEVGNSRMSDDEIKRHIRSQLSSMSIQSPSNSNHHLHPINRNHPHPTSKSSSNRESSLEKASCNDIMKTNDNKNLDDQEEEIECEVMKGYPNTSSSDDQKIEWLKSHLQEERRKFEEEHHKVSFFFSCCKSN